MTERIYSAVDQAKLLPGGVAVLRNLFEHRVLLLKLTVRAVKSKYRGALLGIVWAVAQPLLLLAIYSFVFGLVLKVRWNPEGEESVFFFALMLFCGLVPFSFFSEVLSSSSMAILTAPSYVKKVAFPVELLTVSSFGCALFHALISSVLLMVVAMVIGGGFRVTMLLLPLVWLPLMIWALALGMVVSALGVFLRDLPHVVGLIVSLLFFMTPVFYPSTMVPPSFKLIVTANPVAYTAISFRRILVHGLLPDFALGGIFVLLGLIALILACGWFNLMQRRFADVL